jgi:choline dehydrogenase-like flavoprotein
VLEAGNDTTSDSHSQIPALWPGLLNTENEWGFNIAPQAALGGKEFLQPQGRQLGGSSGLNGMMFIANSRANVDAWGAPRNEEWDWDTLAPYYRKMFRLSLPKDPAKIEELGLQYVDIDENGVSGSMECPIQASFPDAVDDLSAGAWVRTLSDLGYTLRGIRSLVTPCWAGISMLLPSIRSPRLAATRRMRTTCPSRTGPTSAL